LKSQVPLAHIKIITNTQDVKSISGGYQDYYKTYPQEVKPGRGEDIKIITKTYPQDVKPDRGEDITIITKP
jgi:hypothetical protein